MVVNPKDLELYIACCKFYLGDPIEQSVFESYKGEQSALCNRLQIYVNRKKDFKDDSVEELQAKLSSVGKLSDSP